MIFQSQVVTIGPEASRFLDEGILLLFSAESVMTQIKNYSITIGNISLAGDIKVGQNLVLGSESFTITAVGNIAQDNLADIGHATIKADGSQAAELPGTIYVEAKPLPSLQAGDVIRITD
ncbi:PTS glucitol/sorbitol transporter subunit IIA [Enterococcus sp. LJL120]